MPGASIEDLAELDDPRQVIPGAEITVCRVVADEALRTRRLRARMRPGPSRDWHLARTVELEQVLDECASEDLRVTNGARDVRDVALDVLVRTGWFTS